MTRADGIATAIPGMSLSTEETRKDSQMVRLKAVAGQTRTAPTLADACAQLYLTSAGAIIPVILLMWMEEATAGPASQEE
jgi:hypothetical protein